MYDGPSGASLKVRPYPIVEVKWHDAFVNPRWMTATQGISNGESTETVLSVGYLVKKSKKVVILASGAGESGDFSSWHSIPMGMVKKIRKIAPIDEEA